FRPRQTRYDRRRYRGGFRNIEDRRCGLGEPVVARVRVTFPLMWIILAISVVSSVIIAILFATGFPEH
ncbi:hypothetical protein, partial [Gordonia aichiensis]